MKITIKNIGPVKESTIDLDKNLLVLCGGNNTGKTYVAYTVYGVYDFWRSIAHVFPNNGKFNHLLSEFPDKDVNVDILAISEIVAKDIKSYFSNYPILNNIFGIENAHPPLFKDSTIELDFDVEKLTKTLIQREIRGAGAKAFDTTVSLSKQEGEHFFKIQAEIGSRDESRKTAISFANSTIYNPFISELFKNRPYIETAERSSINLFNTEILLYRGFGAVKAFGENKEYRRYPNPIEDALQIAEDLEFKSKNISSFKYLSDILERDFINGKVHISEKGEVMYQTEESSVDVPIHLSASVVKSLSSIIFYFRHIARKGDFIIIDEPELNLHPDNQRRIARWLVRVVNAGFKVMITTHSDYIIREFNNLIMLQTAQDKEARQKLMEEFNYDEEELLNPEQVGAYLFKKDGSCEDLQVSNIGFSVESIDKEISKLNTIADALYYKLHDE